MKVSKRFALLYFLSSFLMGAIVSLLVYLNRNVPDFSHTLSLVIGLLIVILLLVISGNIYHYHQALKRAKNNLDEAQALAKLGSWERDLITGSGYWSRNHYRMFGLEPGGKAPSMDEFFSFIHEEDRERARESVSTAIATKSSYEIRYRLADDQDDRIFSSTGRVLLDDREKPATIVGTIQDITEKQRQNQFQLDLLRQKDLFITRLGHDLKTPLTPLVALMPLIRNRSADEKQIELIDICSSSVNHIRNLVAKTLELARLSSPVKPKLDFANVSLASAIDGFLLTMSTRIEERGVAVYNTISSALTVRADLHELEYLFLNLLNNSINFSPSGSTVTITATEDNTHVTVAVQDNGIGLAAEELPHIFEEFYKADQSRTGLGSSGLGLNICKMIVKNHGGWIWGESAGKGCGTTISFTLPRGEVE